MRIAVAGGTGLVGRQVDEALRRLGHESVVMSRSTGVDLVTGEGLDSALEDVDAVIDVTSTPTLSTAETIAFFEATTANLFAAERAAGVGRHVLLSIVGVERIASNAHYAGKQRQEELVKAGPVPARIVRATQFFDFAEMVAGWTRDGDVASVPPLLVQPIAVADIAGVLVVAATDREFPDTVDIAGPEPQDLVDMARRTLAARGESVKLVPTWQGPLTAEMAGEVLLPGPHARIMPTTFDEWLASL